MKTHIAVKVSFLLAVLLALSVTVGCASILGHNATQNSLPVELGVATTNDNVAVAYTQLAEQINTKFNPTPTQEPISLALNGLVVLLSTLSGWYMRHKTVPPDAKP